MARTVEQINSYIVAQLVTGFAAINITIDPTTWSRRNMLRAICYTFAIGQALMEQLNDLLQQTLESIQAKSAAASPLWVQDAMFRFQYSATVPQILQFLTVSLTSATGIPFSYSFIEYPVIDTTLRVINACSVKTNVSGQVRVKIATGNPLASVGSTILAAAQSYIVTKGAAGITYIVSSLDADRIYIEGNIWYQGSYSAIIHQKVIDALDTFFQNLSLTDFDGSIKVSDIERLIRSVPGVNDVVIVNMKCRPNSTIFASADDIIVNSQTISRLYNTAAGYIIQEDTPTKTFADTLTFIAQ